MWKQTPEEGKKKLSMRIRGSFYCFCMLSCVRLFETPWTAALPGSFDHDFPGKNTGVGCHCLLSGIEPWSPALSGRFFTTEPPGKPIIVFVNCIYLQLSHSWLSILYFCASLLKMLLDIKRDDLLFFWLFTSHWEHGFFQEMIFLKIYWWKSK